MAVVGCHSLAADAKLAESSTTEFMPFHEKVVSCKFLKHQLSYKAFFVIRTGLYLLFLRYRVTTSFYKNNSINNYNGSLSSYNQNCSHLMVIVALACEVVLGITSHLGLLSRWFPLERATHPDRLIIPTLSSSSRKLSATQSPRRSLELPHVDVFVTTADPLKEPPLITINTVLSVLALDYGPASSMKVACYVSDDGGSLLTLWALTQAAAFSRIWVPFCRRFEVEPRAPGPYFRYTTAQKKKKTQQKPNIGNVDCNCNEDLASKEWEFMKAEYVALQRRLDNMTTQYGNMKSETSKLLLDEIRTSTPNFINWDSYDPGNHPAVFQVVLGHTQVEEGTNIAPLDDSPLLVYIAREKRPQYKHHFKAGAMNALTRVSAISTNAPFILNLDCDMYVNDSRALLHAMCFYMDPNTDRETGFVQFQLCFEGVDEDDIYGHNMTAALQVILRSMDGLQGPVYCGTGCVHKRQALYGQKPVESLEVNSGLDGGQCETDEHTQAKFGHSSILRLSCAYATRHTLSPKSGNYVKSFITLSGGEAGDGLANEACKLMSCTYEDGTQWGKTVGWIYGSMTEDLLLSLRMHGRGWRSVLCSPSPAPAFIAGVPTTSEDTLNTRKRWATGMLEVLFSTHSPLLYRHGINQGLTLLQRLVYIWCFSIPVVCLPLFTYATLPALSLLSQSSFLPKVFDPEILLPLGLFASIYAGSFYESTLADVGVREWWNTERMDVIVSVSSYLFAAFDVLRKLMGLSETLNFALTPKDHKNLVQPLADSSTSEEDQGHINDRASKDDCGNSSNGDHVGFVVNSSSPLFIPPTTLVLLNFVGLVMGMVRRGGSIKGLMEEAGGEVLCAVWVLFVLWPFVRGLMYFFYKGGPLALRASTIAYSSLVVAGILLLLSTLLF